MTTPNADGPDLSHYQTITGKPIDPAWTVCTHKATEGRTSFDKTFPARWDWMHDQGFKYRGAYHWLRSDSSMADQADNLVATVNRAGGLDRGDFIQADWETTLNIAPLTARQIVEWCDRVEQAFGRECVIVYSSDWVPQFPIWRALEPDRPLWYANYVTGTGSAGGWVECAKWGAAVWQWTSSFVHASIGGRFDMNHVFDFATLDRLTDQLRPPEPDEMYLFNVKPSTLGAGPLFATGDGLTAVWLTAEQWEALGNPQPTELLERDKCRRYLLVGECPDGYRNIWGQDTRV